MPVLGPAGETIVGGATTTRGAAGSTTGALPGKASKLLAMATTTGASSCVIALS
jgi:hypothetical protein